MSCLVEDRGNWEGKEENEKKKEEGNISKPNPG